MGENKMKIYENENVRKLCKNKQKKLPAETFWKFLNSL